MDRDFRYDVGQLFQLAFGINPPVMFPYPLHVRHTDLPDYTVSEEIATKPDASFQGIQVVEQKPVAGRKSQYGKPLLSPIQFVKGEYKQFDRYGVLQKVSMETFHLPATTMVDFSRSKVTPLTFQNTIEPDAEMYGFNNWDIKIRGLCLADAAHPTHKTPQEQKEAILKWENLASGIYVAGKVFMEKSIFYMSIQKINITQIEGRPNVVPFELDCISLTAPEDQIL